MSVVELKTGTERLQASAREILEDALRQNFKTVVIVGVTPGGQVHTKHSGTDSTLELLGALAHAQHEVHGKWE